MNPEASVKVKMPQKDTHTHKIKLSPPICAGSFQLKNGKQPDIATPEGPECISFFYYGSNGWMYFLGLARQRDECQHNKYFLINP